MPFLRPLTVQEVESAPLLQVRPPGVAVTVYLVMGLPPLEVGGVQETSTEESAGVARMPVGGSGTVRGVT
ncbi:MAG: hypothetical protein WCF12_07755 [Propionicimonas sp.]